MKTLFILCLFLLVLISTAEQLDAKVIMKPEKSFKEIQLTIKKDMEKLEDGVRKAKYDLEDFIDESSTSENKNLNTAISRKVEKLFSRSKESVVDTFKEAKIEFKLLIEKIKRKLNGVPFIS
ncbi:MAG: hypothetical protein CME70_10405 [Halobacteriovorax sp.]|nr:hypothetical protein [Halobacteriovorax sp.]|tara:strand:- start:134734 stop:135099 length:366 start_codon:yes stop_codon:yes gene_type:complete